MTELRTEEVHALRRAFSRVYGPERSALLRAALGRPIRAPKALKEWHDLLLFLLAHPADEQEYEAATAELERTITLAHDMVRRSDRHRYTLINSGLEGLSLQSTFTLHLTRWMLEHWADAMELFAVEAPMT